LFSNGYLKKKFKETDLYKLSIHFIQNTKHMHIFPFYPAKLKFNLRYHIFIWYQMNSSFPVIAKPVKLLHAIFLKETGPAAIFVRISTCFICSPITYSESETFYTRTHLYVCISGIHVHEKWWFPNIHIYIYIDASLPHL